MPELDDKEKRIVETVDILVEDMVDFACRLVAEPSTLGNEGSVLAAMESEFKKLGFSAERLGIDPVRLQEHPGFASVPWEYKNRYNIVVIRIPIRNTFSGLC